MMRLIYAAPAAGVLFMAVDTIRNGDIWLGCLFVAAAAIVGFGPWLFERGTYAPVERESPLTEWSFPDPQAPAATPSRRHSTSTAPSGAGAVATHSER